MFTDNLDMSPLGHHIRIHLADNRVIARSAQEQRILARVVLRQGRPDGLLAFSVPDTHLHLQALCSVRDASRLSQRITASLRQRLGLPVPFVAYPHEPIRSQQHMSNGLRYIVTQHRRHGVPLHSFLEATSIPDLLGARLLGQYIQDNVQRCLPRLRRSTLLEWLGLAEVDLQREPEPSDASPQEILGATLAATALPDLTGKSRPVVAARRAFLQVTGSRSSSAEEADVLGLTRRAVTKLKRQPANLDLVQAIHQQLRLMHLL